MFEFLMWGIALYVAFKSSRFVFWLLLVMLLLPLGGDVDIDPDC